MAQQVSTMRWRSTATSTTLAAAAAAVATSVASSSASILPARSSSALSLARLLQPPDAVSTTGGETEDASFWDEHEQLIKLAWKEWELSLRHEEEGGGKAPSLSPLQEGLVAEPLRSLVQQMWEEPTAEREGQIRNLLQAVVPGVFQFQLFSVQAVETIRQHLDAVRQSRIPLRRPNGMNRYGLVLDDRTPGGVAYTELLQFQQQVVVDRFVRPLGRLLFPDLIGPGDDADSYAFTIRYQHGEDRQLAEHSDASVVTLNVNLNLPNETFAGSSIYFVDPDDPDVKHPVEWNQPGMAVLHRGMQRHAALPIESGERHNMVIWLFGEHGYVRIAPYEKEEQLTLQQRWTPETTTRQQQQDRIQQASIDIAGLISSS